MESESTPKCSVCGNYLTPANECKNIATGEWDEHSYRCEWCNKRSSLVLSIG